MQHNKQNGKVKNKPRLVKKQCLSGNKTQMKRIENALVATFKIFSIPSGIRVMDSLIK